MHLSTSILKSCRTIKLSSIFALVAICTMAYGQTSVRFVVEDLPSLENKKVGIRGNLFPLDWNKSLVLKRDGDFYVINITFPSHEKELEFKFVIFTDDENPTWKIPQTEY